MDKLVALQCSGNNVESLKEVFRVTPLASRVRDANQCMVCLYVMKPAVIFATRCEKLIAYKDCMRHWVPDTCRPC